MPLCNEPAKPITELRAIIQSEVTIAFFIGILPKSTNAGMMRNPPPAPTKPARMPTEVPCKKRITFFLASTLPSPVVRLLGFLIIDTEERIITIENITIKETSLVKSTPLIENKIFGITGMIKALVRYTDMMDGMPKMNTIGKITDFWMIPLIPPIKEVMPTINKEYVVARIGSIPRM